MKCYHCGENEADYCLLVHMMGKVAEVHLCGECLADMQEHFASMMQYVEEESDSSQPVREMGSDPFPTDAGEEFKNRRELIELRARLRDAVEREEYELAAQLRDMILKKEEGALVYDT